MPIRLSDIPETKPVRLSDIPEQEPVRLSDLAEQWLKPESVGLPPGPEPPAIEDYFVKPEGGRFRGRGATGSWAPRTLGEKIKETNILDILGKLPFSPLHDWRKKGAEEAKRKLRTGDYGQRQYAMGGHGFGAFRPARPKLTPADLAKIVEDQEERQARGETIPAAIAGGITDLPAYMMEMLAGGIGKVKSVPGAAKFAGKMTVLQPARIETAMIDQINRGETGGMALAKAWGDVYIENISETAGAGFGKAISRLPFGGKLMEGLRKFAKSKGISDSEFWKTVGTKVGYNGLLAEWGEERIGTYLRGLTGVQDFGAGKDATADERIAAGFEQDFQARNMLIETGVLLAPGTVKYVGKKILGPEPGRKTPYEPGPGVAEPIPHISEAVDTTGLPPVTEAIKPPEIAVEPTKPAEPTVTPVEEAHKLEKEFGLEIVPPVSRDIIEKLRKSKELPVGPESIRTMVYSRDIENAPSVDAIRENLKYLDDEGVIKIDNNRTVFAKPPATTAKEELKTQPSKLKAEMEAKPVEKALSATEALESLGKPNAAEIAVAEAIDRGKDPVRAYRQYFIDEGRLYGGDKRSESASNKIVARIKKAQEALPEPIVKAEVKKPKQKQMKLLAGLIKQANDAGAKLRLGKNPKYGKKDSAGKIDDAPHILSGKDTLGRQIKMAGAEGFLYEQLLDNLTRAKEIKPAEKKGDKYEIIYYERHENKNIPSPIVHKETITVLKGGKKRAQEYGRSIAKENDWRYVSADLVVPREARSIEEQPTAITRAEKDALQAKGLTVPQILKMKPEQARELLLEVPAEEVAEIKKAEEKKLEQVEKKVAKRVVSKEAYEKAKKRLTDTGTFRMGIDPHGFVDLITVGAYHFENGLRSFKQWSDKMIEEFGRKVKPQLKGIWNDVRSSADPDILQVRQAIKNAKRLTPDIQEKQRKERRRRVGQLAGQLKTSLQKPGSAEQAIGRAKGALKGPLTEYKGLYESIRTPDNAQAIDNAFRSIGESPTLSPLGKISTHAAFTKLVDGDAITLGEASLLEQHFGRSWGKLLQSRIPTADMLWKLFQETINVPRTTLASGDVSGIGRQARPLGQIHPVLYAQMVAKYHKAFWSQESAEALEEATKQMPYYNEAKDDGVLELPEWGLFSAEVIEREERFAGAQIAEKIPGVGIVVRASERSFVTALNWFRVAVYNQIRTQQDISDIKTTKAERTKIAGRINDLSGRSHIKRSAAAKAIQPLLNTLFSARFTISRFKPIVTLPLDAVRSIRNGKLSIELKMGAGALMSLAATNFLIMYLVKLAGGDDEVETEFDLRATDGGKLKIGPTRIDLWSGYLQPAQLMVRLATGERKSAAGTVFEVSRTKIMEDFVRSKLNPQAGLVVDAYTGETFIGERILQPPDPEKGPGRILTGIGVPSWVQGVGRGLLWNRMMFLTVQDAADAYMDNGAAMGAVAGMLAWSGTGVTTYLPRASTQLIIEQNKMANTRYGEKWEELTAAQQKNLSRNSTLKGLERKKKAERSRSELDLSFIEAEANKARKRIRRELPDIIQNKLDEFGISISAPSRRLGKFRLNDNRYEYYQAEYIKGLKKALPRELRKRNPEIAVKKKADTIKSMVRIKLNSLIRRNEI